MIFINTTGTYLKIPEVLFMDDSDKKNHNGFYASLYTSRTLLKIRLDSFFYKFLFISAM